MLVDVCVTCTLPHEASTTDLSLKTLKNYVDILKVCARDPFMHS